MGNRFAGAIFAFTFAVMAIATVLSASAKDKGAGPKMKDTKIGEQVSKVGDMKVQAKSRPARPKR